MDAKEHSLQKPGGGASGDQPVKVLYVAGWGRSGSTVLGRILGEVEGFFLAGELRYIWDRGLIEDRLCSCGSNFTACPVWREVVSGVLGNGGPSARELVGMREGGLRTRHVLLAPTRRSLQSRVARMQEYLGVLERLYRAVQAVSGSRVIVDTSKFPSYGYLLQNAPGIELYVLHMVRDPRAVAHSWTTRKLKSDNSGEPGGFVTRHSAVESSLVWDEWNLAAERMGGSAPQRYMLLRYEDFVESPRSSVRDVLRFLGEEAAEAPFVDERTVRLDTPHIFSGNPDRFCSGTVEVRRDEEWRRGMSASRQAAVTALTWFGLRRYGYPLRPLCESQTPGA